MLVFLVLGNTKVLHFASGDAKVPNANVFALQWNIGFKPQECSRVDIGKNDKRKFVF